MGRPPRKGNAWHDLAGTDDTPIPRVFPGRCLHGPKALVASLFPAGSCAPWPNVVCC